MIEDDTIERYKLRCLKEVYDALIEYHYNIPEVYDYILRYYIYLTSGYYVNQHTVRSPHPLFIFFWFFAELLIQLDPSITLKIDLEMLGGYISKFHIGTIKGDNSTEYRIL